MQSDRIQSRTPIFVDRSLCSGYRSRSLRYWLHVSSGSGSHCHRWEIIIGNGNKAITEVQSTAITFEHHFNSSYYIQISRWSSVEDTGEKMGMWVLLALALSSQLVQSQAYDLVSASNTNSNGSYGGSELVMNYYENSCPQVEEIIAEQVRLLYKRHKNTAFSWLRNIFHDCAVEVISLLILSSVFACSLINALNIVVNALCAIRAVV